MYEIKEMEEWFSGHRYSVCVCGGEVVTDSVEGVSCHKLCGGG